MNLKSFFTTSRNVERDSYVWNMIGGLLRGFRSVVFLMILSRTVGLVMSGIFTIANANSNLFLHMGNYNMRNFQVSDVKKEYQFKDYFASRMLTIATMVVISIGYAVVAGWGYEYSLEKIQILIWMCLYKVADALEDVYFGEFQRKGRMDIGAKMMTLRLVFTMVVFAVAVILTKDLLLTIVISTVLTMLVLFYFISCTKAELPKEEDYQRNYGKIFRLLGVCFPVFLSGFLAFYISNSGKYAVDAVLSDEFQAYFGFISMPVLVIGMLSGFVFNPTLYYLAKAWNEGNLHGFVKRIFVTLLIVTGITGMSVLGAYFLGVPVLNLFYETDVSLYKAELLLLLAAAGVNAITDFMVAIITILRKQRVLILGYGLVALLALVLTREMVLRFHIMGAVVLFGLLEILMGLIFAAVIIYVIRRNAKEKK